jgi:type IV pilus assembly protein PilB
MALNNQKIKQILLSENYLNKSDMVQAEKEADESGRSLVESLLASNLITKEILGQALAEYYNVPFVDLSKEKIDLEIFGQIPEALALAKQIIAVKQEAGKVMLAMVDPSDKSTAKLVAKKLGLAARPCLVFAADLTEALALYQGSLADEFKVIVKTLHSASLTKEAKDEVIIKIVDMLLRHGYNNKASDIHIEPYHNKIVIRFRIDGVMHDVLEIDKNLAQFIVARIKILAKLPIDEHQSAQDAKIPYQLADGQLDIRVSIVPVTHGENVVLRLLSAKIHNLSLTSLGLTERDLAKVKRAMRYPHGMILVTGPTGSGKTTTLYAALNILNREQVHIATIEDPVEYAIAGVSQIQVNPKTKLTFAEGLRAIVRQDPDIIMVGEIRDDETAGIAVNSALTGHLVLSTLHTNDAATALPRLTDMKVEPFLIASTVNMIIAQRLVRLSCHKCRASSALSAEELMLIKNEPKVRELLAAKGVKKLEKMNLYRGKGCKLCAQTGYYGRIGIFEILTMTDELRELIVKRASNAEINRVAVASGMTTMLEDGLEKVVAGLTTLEEVLRIVKT